MSIKKAANALVYLRIIADSPYLLSETYCTDNFRSNKYMMGFLGQPSNVEHQTILEHSAKLNYLDYMLDKILTDHKVLIFSQFKGMLYLIEDMMMAKDINCVHLTGDTPNS